MKKTRVSMSFSPKELKHVKMWAKAKRLPLATMAKNMLLDSTGYNYNNSIGKTKNGKNIFQRDMFE